MILHLSHDDKYRLEQLFLTQERNEKILRLYSDYLNYNENAISAQQVESLMNDCGIDKKTAVCALLSSFFGIDGDTREEKILNRYYLENSVEISEPSHYSNDAYYKNIEIPKKTLGAWELRRMAYVPYQPFVRDDILLMPDFSEIPRLGFFDSRFPYPAVLENDIEWMCVTPNEINTLKEFIKKAEGNVITFGLGLGYFAYMASQKDEVSAVTVVERDENVITLFNKSILPQFSNKDKIRIIKADAFEFADSKMENGEYDYALADTWHDAGDGFDMYLRFKEASRNTPDTVWDYWIENSLLSRARFIVMNIIRDSFYSPQDHKDDKKTVESFDVIKEMLSDNALKKTVLHIKKQQ